MTVLTHWITAVWTVSWLDDMPSDLSWIFLKQEVYRLYRSPKKQFQSMNTFAQSTCAMIKMKKKSWPFWEFKAPISVLHKVAFCPDWLKLSQKRFLNFHKVSSRFFNHSPLERSTTLHLISIHLWMCCAKIGWNWLSDSWEKEKKMES